MRWLDVRVALVFVALALVASPVRAQEDGGAGDADERVPDDDVSEEDYRALIGDAVRHTNAGRFQEALALFLRAHELRPTARTLRGIGLVRFQLGDYAVAIATLEQALSDMRRPLDVESQAEVRETIERAMAFVARVEIEVSPSGATITDNGRALVVQDGVALFNPGRHQVALEHPGYRAETHTWIFDGGERRRFELALIPTAGEPRMRRPGAQPRADAASIPIAVRSTQAELRLHATPFAAIEDPQGGSDVCFAPCDAALPRGRYQLGITRGVEPTINVGLLDLTEPVEVTLAYDDREELRIAGWLTFAASLLVPTVIWSVASATQGTAAAVLGAFGGVSFLVAFPISMVLVGFNNGAAVRVAPLEDETP